MRPDPCAELLRLVESDIAAFEARLRDVVPAYCPGDRVEFGGEVFEVTSYQRVELPGYWLRGEREKTLFFPVDLEKDLQPVLH